MVDAISARFIPSTTFYRVHSPAPARPVARGRPYRHPLAVGPSHSADSARRFGAAIAGHPVRRCGLLPSSVSEGGPPGCAWERHGGRDRGPATRTRPWLLGRRERYPLNGGTEFVTTKSTSRLRQWEQRQRRSTRGASPWPAAIRACRSAWVLRRQLRPESRTATWRAWSVERGVGSSCASGWSSGIGGA